MGILESCPLCQGYAQLRGQPSPARLQEYGSLCIPTFLPILEENRQNVGNHPSTLIYNLIYFYIPKYHCVPFAPSIFHERNINPQKLCRTNHTTK